MRTITVPKTYGEDWFERESWRGDNGDGKCIVLRRTARTIVFSVNHVALADMRDDAKHVALDGMDDVPIEIVHSAARAIRRLTA